jgi:hypothetical protein
MGSHKPLQHSRPPRRRTVPQDSPPDDVPAEGRLLQQLPVAPNTDCSDLAIVPTWTLDGPQGGGIPAAEVGTMASPSLRAAISAT